MVLLDLIDLYDAQERHEEAKALWERIRKILHEEDDNGDGRSGQRNA